MSMKWWWSLGGLAGSVILERGRESGLRGTGVGPRNRHFVLLCSLRERRFYEFMVVYTLGRKIIVTLCVCVCDATAVWRTRLSLVLWCLTLLSLSEMRGSESLRRTLSTRIGRQSDQRCDKHGKRS